MYCVRSVETVDLQPPKLLKSPNDSHLNSHTAYCEKKMRAPTALADGGLNDESTHKFEVEFLRRRSTCLVANYYIF